MRAAAPARLDAPVRRLLVLVAAVVLVDTSFYASITPLLPRYVEVLGLTKTHAGVLAGAYAAGTLVAAVPAGWAAGRFGARPVLLAGLALMSAASVVFAFAPGAVVLDLARFAQGVGGAGSWAAAMAWLVLAAPADRRGELIGVAVGAAVAGALLGPVLGGAAEVAGPRLVFSVVALVGVGLALWALLLPRPPAEEVAQPGVLAGALRSGGVLAGMGFVALPALAFGTIGVLAPLRLDELGLGGVAIGATFLVAAGCEALLSPLVGRVSDRHDRLLPVRGGLLAAALLVPLLALPGTGWLLAAGVVGAACGLGVLWAPAMALLSERAEARGLTQGVAFGLMNLAWGAGQVLGSAGGARLADSTADAVPYALVGLTCLAALASLRGRRAKAAT
jgi:MFS family permease